MTDTQVTLLNQDNKHNAVLEKLIEVYSELFSHDGYGDFSIEMKILRRGQKEVIIHCGKQHRFVLDCDQALINESALKHLLKRDLLK
jgi:hypothetical protein